MKYSALVFSAALMFAVPASVFAQTAGNSVPPAPPQTAYTVATAAGGVRATIKNASQTYQMQLQAARQTYQTQIQTIKDTKKQAIVQDINIKIPQINTAQTTRMTASLTEMTNTLARITAAAATIQSQGKSITSVNSAVAAAQTAITGAQVAVTAQSTKQYVLTITSETTLRQTITPVVTQFRTDLINTQITVKNARLTLIKAYQALMQARGVPVVSQTPVTGSGSATAVQPIHQ